MAGPSFEIESHHLTATLYVHRPLAATDLRDVRIACALLPPEVRQLRIDARALADAEQGTRDILREVVRYWRRTRSQAIADPCARLRGRRTARMVPLPPPPQ